MKRILPALFLLMMLFPSWLAAQDKRIISRGFDADILELRAKTDPVYDKNNQPAAMVSVFLAATDTLSFKGNILGQLHPGPGEWILYIPAGSEWVEVASEGYDPLHFDFPADKPLLSAYGYTLNLGVLLTNPLRSLIMPSFSYNQSQTAYGLMLGIGKRNGVYVHAKSDFNFGLNPTLSCDDAGKVDGVQAWFTGNAKKSRLALTGGYLRKLSDALYLYAGGGYGSRILAWEMYVDDGHYEYARVEPKSFTGYEAELGLIVRAGIVAFSAGIQTNQFKYYEANAGIGLMF
ncbi:MAG: hypothetical protein IKX53_09970 [Bacteroidales bacterium]|nr:hypothetical protein [Bacteroidales bacterium]